MNSAVHKFFGSLRDSALHWLTSHLKVHVGDGIHQNPNNASVKQIYVFRRPSFLEQFLFRWILQHQIQKSANATLEISPLFLRNRTGNEITLNSTLSSRKRIIARIETEIHAGTIQQKTLDFIPVSFFAGLGPQPWPKPLSWKVDFTFLPLADLWLVFVFIIQRKSLRLTLGNPLVLPPPSSADKVLSAQQLYKSFSLALYRQEKLARGALQHTADTIDNIVLSGEHFEEILREHAIATGDSRDTLYWHAHKLLHSMAATFHGPSIRILHRILAPLMNRIFSSIELSGLDTLRDAIRHRPVVLLPNHRSHIDYLLLSFALYREGLPLPYIAAGDNLNFWPVGRLLKSAGGFFIRRRIEKDPLYKIVLERYLHYLIKRGHLLEFYIEGGRSRSGLTRQPKLGLMKYVIRCALEGGRRDILFIPVSITYERLAEEKSLIREIAGSKKIKEGARGLIRSRKVFGMHLGSVNICFNKPLSLRECEDSPSTSAGLPQLIEHIGYATSDSFMQSLQVTGTSLLAGAFLACGSRKLHKYELLSSMRTILSVLDSMNKVENLKSPTYSKDLHTLLETKTPDEVLEILLQQAVTSHWLHVNEDGVCTIENRSQLYRFVYYKNHLLHRLLPLIFAFLGQETKEDSRSVSALQKLLRPKLAPFRSETYDTAAQALLPKLLEQALQNNSGDDSSAVVRASLLSSLWHISGLIAPILQSICLVSEYAAAHTDDERPSPLPAEYVSTLFHRYSDGISQSENPEDIWFEEALCKPWTELAWSVYHEGSSQSGAIHSGVFHSGVFENDVLSFFQSLSEHIRNETQ